jgi:hypothetical protein
VDVAKFAVSRLEGPLLVRVEVPEADVVDDDVFDEGVAGWGEGYRSMQICMLISCVSFCSTTSGLSSGMKYFLMRSRQ